MSFFYEILNDGTAYRRKELRVKRLILTITAALFVLITLLCSFAIIPSGYTGVRTTFGQIDAVTVANGFTAKIPYVQSIKRVNNKQQEVSYRTQPETICYSADGTVMMSPQGIGGDDRAGVYMILRLIQRVHCHVLFCEDEETGGHGALAFTKSGIKPDVNYIVELDRMGSNDAVFYQCRNRKFERYINNFGFQTAFGSFSDISILAPHLNLAAVNLSTGYYHAHQPGEFVRLDKVEKLIGRVEKLLQTKTERFSYARKPAARRLDEPDGLQRKRLVALLDTHIVRINHQDVADGRGYFMDESGGVYLYLDEHDRMVHIGSAEALCKDGRKVVYQEDNAKAYITIEMEEAVRLLDAECAVAG